MSVNSKVDLCNMALGHMGNFGTVTNIDTPTNNKEITFAIWYDISRQNFLKMTMPNFALARKVIAKADIPPPFGIHYGYQYAYEYPSDCLKVLGIGQVEDKENNYAVESGLDGKTYVWTDKEYEQGLPLRYIKDFTDVTLMSPEFKMGFSVYLASNTVMDITQDVNKANSLLKMLPEKMATLSGLNAQENMPIRKSVSRFMEARWNGFVGRPHKR